MLRYTGQRWDAETGLYHYRARYYSPALGRFLTADPIGYGDGLNVYAYVANDPVNLVDPSGLGAEQNRTTNWNFIEVGPVIPPNNDAIFIVLTDDSRSIDGPLALLSLGGAGSLYKAAKVLKSGSIWSSTKNKSAVENAFGHWKKHKSEFPELQNSKQYVEKATDFLTNPPKGALTKTNSRGDTLRYDPNSNTFGVLSKDGVPRTMFRPKDGMGYWNKQ